MMKVLILYRDFHAMRHHCFCEANPRHPLCGCHDMADAEWMVFRGQLGVKMICPLGGQPPVSLLITYALATLRAYLVFSVTIFQRLALKCEFPCDNCVAIASFFLILMLHFGDNSFPMIICWNVKLFLPCPVKTDFYTVGSEKAWTQGITESQKKKQHFFKRNIYLINEKVRHA
jgi:hypothetical protein